MVDSPTPLRLIVNGKLYSPEDSAVKDIVERTTSGGAWVRIVNLVVDIGGEPNLVTKSEWNSKRNELRIETEPWSSMSTFPRK